MIKILPWLLLVTISACTPLDLVTNAGTHILNAELANRTVGQSVQDKIIYANIKGALARRNLATITSLNVEVFEARVLLHGRATSKFARDRIIAIVENIDGVYHISDALVVDANSAGLWDIGRDQAIVLEMQRRLILDKQVRALNLFVSASFQNLYIMGLARTKTEYDRVLWHADQVSGVLEVIDHVELIDSPVRLARLGVLE